MMVIKFIVVVHLDILLNVLMMQEEPVDKTKHWGDYLDRKLGKKVQKKYASFSHVTYKGITCNKKYYS